jgi:hypothetical protein
MDLGPSMDACSRQSGRLRQVTVTWILARAGGNRLLHACQQLLHPCQQLLHACQLHAYMYPGTGVQGILARAGGMDACGTPQVAAATCGTVTMQVTATMQLMSR